MENEKIAIGAGIFLLVVIGAFLLIPMSQERTLILTTPSNSTGGCSDLDCLNDVVLIDLVNNQILVFNSTSGDWENRNQTSFIDTTICNNLGTGKIICPSYSSGNINLRTLKASTGLSIANDTTSITYTNTLPESTVCSGQTGNYNIVASSSSGNCTFKNLVPSTGISISSNSTHITISNSGVTSITANSPLSASASTGSVTLSCSTCLTTANGDKFIQLAQQSLSASSSILNQNSGTASSSTLDNTFTIDAEKITSTGALVGSQINSITLGLKKTNTPAVTCTIGVFDGSGGTLYTIGTLDSSLLTTSFASYTFVNTDSDYTISSNTDYIGIKCLTGSATNTIQVARTTANAYDGSNSIHSIFSAGSWTDGTTDLGNSSASQNWKVDHFLTSKTFTAKKHLFYTIESRIATSNAQVAIVLNSDTGSNSYALRYSINGGADTTATSQLVCQPQGTNAYQTNDGPFLNGWIDNNQSGDRKLITGNGVTGAETSATTAPAKTEYTCKWSNTSTQITSIGIAVWADNTGDFISGSTITVWGYD